MRYCLGIDIGGTKTEWTVFSTSLDQQSLTPVQSKRFPTPRQSSYALFLNQINLELRPVVEEFSPVSIGVGVPGSLDLAREKMIAGGTSLLLDQALREDLERLFHLPVTLENDANCFALAEAHLGVGKIIALKKNCRAHELSGLGLILGTGLGGGLILNGQLWRGSFNAASEIGHIFLESSFSDCYCKKNGCAELFLSGTGFEDQYRRLAGEKLSATAILDLAKTGEEASNQVIVDYRKRLAHFLANLNNILDLDYYVFGGGLSLAKPLLSGIEDLVYPQLFSPASRPEFHGHSLGDSAGVYGAALCALQKLS